MGFVPFVPNETTTRPTIETFTEVISQLAPVVSYLGQISQEASRELTGVLLATGLLLAPYLPLVRFT